MPRCTDYSSTETYLARRNIYQKFINGSDAPERRPLDASQVVMAINGSRISAIDEYIRPGPYKELLPCKQLCYGLVQSCPASLGFACPLQNHNLNSSYGEMLSDGQQQPMCNMPGWVTPFSGGFELRPKGLLLLFGILIALFGVGN